MLQIDRCINLFRFQALTDYAEIQQNSDRMRLSDRGMCFLEGYFDSFLTTKNWSGTGDDVFLNSLRFALSPPSLEA